VLLDDGTPAVIDLIRRGYFWLNTIHHGPGAAIAERQHVRHAVPAGSRPPAARQGIPPMKF
jgi:hypothetical protein